MVSLHEEVCIDLNFIYRSLYLSFILLLRIYGYCRPVMFKGSHLEDMLGNKIK